MQILKKSELKKEIENLSSNLSSKDAQNIFYDIVFKKKVEEGLKDADEGLLTDWELFKKEMQLWYK